MSKSYNANAYNIDAHTAHKCYNNDNKLNVVILPGVYT